MTQGNTSEGAKQGAETRKKKYGPNYHKEIGSRGGSKNKGKKHSEETKKKISKTLKERKNKEQIEYENPEILA